MGEVGCYVLDLYCDSSREDCPELKAAQFTGSTADDARKAAHDAGWSTPTTTANPKLGRYPVWRCPSCTKNDR